MQILDSIASKAAAITTIVAFIGVLFTGMNVMYAKAADVEKLSVIFQQSQISEYEEELRDIEQQVAELSAKEDITEPERVRLQLLQQRRERYLQTLSDLREAK